jgi:hypothetical protein
MDNRKLMALADTLRSKTLAEVDQELSRRHLDASERLSVKIQLQAAPQRHTVQAGFRLLTDAPHQDQAPVRSEMDRLLHRLDLAAGDTVTMAELEQRMAAQNLTAEQRIACKLEAAARGLLATQTAEREADRLLRNLGIDGPVSLEAIERTMD